MIKVKVGDEIYTIQNGSIVSDGKIKHFVEDCVRMASTEYKGPSDGFFEPWLYMRLARFKSIKPVSCDFKPPKDDNIIY